MAGFHDFEPCRACRKISQPRISGGRGLRECSWWDEVSCYCVHTVKGAGENEEVIGVELLEARVKVAIVDETAGLVDN